MDKVIAKFRCNTADVGSEAQNCYVGIDPDSKEAIYDKVTPTWVGMTPVVGQAQGTEENDVFFRSTPGGSLGMRVMNNAIVESAFFEVGAEYLVTFEKVSP